MKTAHTLIAAAMLVCISVPASAQAAITCIVNQKTGQFKSADKNRDPDEVQEACASPISLDLLAAFADAESSVESGGTKILSGVIVTNLNDVTSNLSAALRAKRAREAEQARAEAAKPVEPTTWEILDTDKTLQKTLARWGALASWDVIWEDVPEIKNPGYVKLPGRSFLSAVEYVILKAQVAASNAGFTLDPATYTNRTLVISKKELKK